MKKSIGKVIGTVVHGAGRGRELGIPTANLAIEDPQSIPQDGVYAAWATLPSLRGVTNGSDEAIYPTAVSIGTNSTFNATERTVEAHLLDFDGNLYGKQITLALIAYLRPMRRFASSEALVQQIKEDIEEARKIINRKS